MAEAAYDLAILGAGVMGLFTALFASRRGARTLVLDAWRIGDSRAASYSLTRSIRSDYLDPLYARLAYEARKLWLDFQAESGEPFLIECGCLDLKTRAFDRVGLHARFPQFDADIGRLDVEAGFLYVPPITQTLLAGLRAARVDIEQDTRVERISRRQGRTVIDTSAGERLAQRLVFTAGLGVNDLLARTVGCNLQLPIRPDRPSESKYFVPPLEKREQFMPERLPVFAYLDVGIYGHPMLQGKTPGVKIGYYNPPDVRRQRHRCRGGGPMLV